MRPNIIFIVTEQHRADCVGYENHPVLLTPNLDNIAHNGVRFGRFYSACPSCISARRSMLTGQLPQTHGLVGYREGLEWDTPTLPGVLRDHGYQTHLVGRSMHQFPARRRHGYEAMEIACHTEDSDYDEYLRTHGPSGQTGWYGGGVMHNDWTAHPWHLDEHLHQTNWTVDRALHFLRRRDPSCPFFLTVSFIGAHPPLQPPAFYLDRYLRTGVPEPAIGDWATPPGAGETDLVAPHRVDLQGEASLSTRAAYYGLINHIDDQLRRLLNPIVGLSARDTLIVFTSDHGELLGDHYLWRKGHPLEGSARVPFAVAGPESLGLQRGTSVDAPCTHADIMPTLLELAGVPIPESVDGQSLVPMLRGEEAPCREVLHIEHAGFEHGLTDGTEKYLWNPATGRELLFDLTQDPEERHDLAVSPQAASRVAIWRQRLAERLADRPDDVVADGELVPGRPCPATLPHAGNAHAFARRRFV
ncbi:MAG: sulfatase-like hydrolase/transferase [Victivallales bacterium]|jgi:arylsulfatase|nr:sulfatase-like hydrolase/transferase [Victivallales bacterium]MBT7163438.1 sulfatase-like hydrolase/transferase [Victivallales bacterium]